MSKQISRLGISKTADRVVSQLEQVQKLKEVANRKNYSHKVKLLYERIKEQYDFWEQKQNPQEGRLLDVKRDLSYIESQLTNTAVDKEKIDQLMYKYGYQ